MHLPLVSEPGIRREFALLFEATERRALAAARLVVVTGQTTVAALERYGVDRDRVVVVEPGTMPAPLARGSVDGPLQLLSVAALTPGKGHDTLFRALASIPSRRWRLTCAGTLERHPPTAARMRALLREQGLDNQVWLGGELSEGMVADSYNRADVFVHPSLHETYGRRRGARPRPAGRRHQYGRDSGSHRRRRRPSRAAGRRGRARGRASAGDGRSRASRAARGGRAARARPFADVGSGGRTNGGCA